MTAKNQSFGGLTVESIAKTQNSHISAAVTHESVIFPVST
jgi:hypothetical protein